MTSRGFTLFDTQIGRCAIAWRPDGIAAVQLPDKTEAATRNDLLRRCPGFKQSIPPDIVQHVINGIVCLLQGKSGDLSFAVLDLDRIPEFNRKVYEIARTIPAGATLTYGAVASRIEMPDLPAPHEIARAVGKALGQNPFPLIVPCHRVLAASGKTGGFSAPGGVATKLRLLAIEQAHTSEGPTLFDYADTPRSHKA